MESTSTRTGTHLKILITGAQGQVGYELGGVCRHLGEVFLCDRDRLDLTNPQAIRELVADLKPNLIINSAAYTAVDRAETEPELAIAVNHTAPQVLAEAAAAQGASLIHYSTDYVFDGKLERPYRETDVPNPLSVYGRTKLAGEQAIAAVGLPHLILRTSWVYGTRGKNFMLTMLKLARQKPELKIVADQIGAPTWSRTIARATGEIITRLATAPPQDLSAAIAPHQGIYHLTSQGFTSWYGFAQAIFAADPQAAEQILERVSPITTAEYPTPAQRPLNSRLDLRKICYTFNLRLPDWQPTLAQVLQEYNQGQV
ncbi:MAG: dTDP-4-dehydrorhamnose reductase [Pseudanabaenaceae cyanobacterium bins.68]|nr:dTDP-4-dehydrorhamnose reductase [Pseudanabaenaceae cyanobacterium bins.68]